MQGLGESLEEDVVLSGSKRRNSVDTNEHRETKKSRSFEIERRKRNSVEIDSIEQPFKRLCSLSTAPRSRGRDAFYCGTDVWSHIVSFCWDEFFNISAVCKLFTTDSFAKGLAASLQFDLSQFKVDPRGALRFCSRVFRLGRGGLDLAISKGMVSTVSYLLSDADNQCDIQSVYEKARQCRQPRILELLQDRFLFPFNLYDGGLWNDEEPLNIEGDQIEECG